MLTNRAKVLIGTIGAVVIVGGLSYPTYLNTKAIVALQNEKAIVVTKTVVVTPTSEPTATPSAIRIYTPAKASYVTKGVTK